MYKGNWVKRSKWRVKQPLIVVGRAKKRRKRLFILRNNPKMAFFSPFCLQV